MPPPPAPVVLPDIDPLPSTTRVETLISAVPPLAPAVAVSIALTEIAPKSATVRMFAKTFTLPPLPAPPVSAEMVPAPRTLMSTDSIEMDPPLPVPFVEAERMPLSTVTVGAVSDTLAVLLADGTLNYCWHDHAVAWFMNCSDVFAWACADCEPFDLSELEKFYRMSLGKWGTLKWVCIKRNQQPQPPIIKDMKAQGAWDETMEALPANTMDAETQRIFAAVKARQDG